MCCTSASMLWHTSTPLKLDRITPGNLKRISRVATLTRGWAIGIAFSHDARFLVVGWAAGVSFLDREILTEVHFVEAVGMRHTEWGRLSPDGKWLTSATLDGKVGVWDASTGQLARTLDVDASEVRGIAFSATDRMVTSERWGERLRVWDLADGALVSAFAGPSGDVPGVTISSDGQVIASWAHGPYLDGRVHLVRAASGELIRVLEEASGSPTGLNPDGTLVLARRGLGGTALWQVSSGTLLQGDTKGVGACAFSPDARYVAVSSSGGSIDVYTTSDGGFVRTFEGCGEGAGHLAFSADSTELAALAGNEVSLWSVADGKLLRAARGAEESVRCLAFSSDSRFLATGMTDGSIRIWRTSDRRLVCTLNGHKSSVFSVCFSPVGGLLASSADDETTRLWRLSDQGQLAETQSGHSYWPKPIAFSPDGQLVAFPHGLGSDPREVRIWPVQQWHAIRGIDSGEHGPASGLAWSPDGRRLAVGHRDDTVSLYGNSGAEETCLDTGSFWGIGDTSVAFSPDGRCLLGVLGESEHEPDNIHEDSVVALWQVSGHEPVYRYTFSHTLALHAWFSPDSSLFAVAYTRAIHEPYLELFRTSDGSSAGSVSLRFDDIAISPDWRTVAVTAGGMVELWGIGSTVPTAQQPATMKDQ